MTRVLTDAEAADLDDLATELSHLRATLAEATERRRDAITRVPISQRASAINLIQYLALRSRDERPLQRRLVGWGLSTLGRSEAHVAATLGAVQRSTALMRDQQVSIEPAPVDMSQAAAVAKSRVDELLGGAPAHRVTRIMVTLPSEAATEPDMVYSLVAAGMDCARINTAHDDEATWKQMVTHVRSAADVLDASCRVLIDLPGPKLRTGAIAPGPTGKEWIALARGDRLILTSGAGDAPKRHRSSTSAHKLPRVACTLPAVLAQVQAGQPIWFDDGKIGGVIEDASPEELTVLITHARAKGERLRSDKGINLPQTAIDLPALGADDLASLPFVARTADLVGLSFAQSPSDVRELRARLNDLAAQQVGIVLKIETVRGFDALPELILAGLEGGLVGVMIARGDLAVEVGYGRLAEVQEEILWLCEAAHTPSIWATQVLETLAHDGRPTRAEVTDAAMGVRAECVMLNKGPQIVATLGALDDILRRMERHHDKKTSLLRELRSWRDGA